MAAMVMESTTAHCRTPLRIQRNRPCLSRTSMAGLTNMREKMQSWS
uniref:Uncharacterized protein n=1 Tax=Mycobacterium riyadhense TaxID=486698 RepID=A0A653ESU5_9MYCO|nr:hypothetical protein BIN_B_03495 [Mycobacterium riyadhense]